ncbi:hypothetical protein ACLOJK_016228 [Asimina triloba]
MDNFQQPKQRTHVPKPRNIHKLIDYMMIWGTPQEDLWGIREGEKNKMALNRSQTGKQANAIGAFGFERRKSVAHIKGVSGMVNMQ